MRTLLVLVVLLGGVVVSAQPPASGIERFAWEQDAADLASANLFTYHYYTDALATDPTATNGPPLSGVLCSDLTPPQPKRFTCVANFPPMTPGPHTLAMAARVSLAGLSIEGPKSNVVAFTLVAAPSAPLNLRIVR